jgi:DNA-binding MarR family transcriptional regulator
LSGRDLKEHIRILTEFRKIDAWMHIQTVYAFVIIAQRTFVNAETLRVMDVGEFMDTSSASASRNLRVLVDHDLIKLYENPDRRIEKFIEVTKRGRALARRIRL